MDEYFVIRKARLRDAKSIMHFNILLAKETEFKELDEIVALEGVKALLSDYNKGFYLISEKVGNPSKIVGQVLITFEWSDWRNKYFWWLQSVYVDKAYRHQKIFFNLFQQIIKLATSRRDVCGLKLYVKTNNESAKQVYASLGMRRSPYEVYSMNLIC